VALGELELCAITSDAIPTSPSANRTAMDFIDVSPPGHVEPGDVVASKTRSFG
jgi:hypothetical protein